MQPLVSSPAKIHNSARPSHNQSSKPNPLNARTKNERESASPPRPPLSVRRKLLFSVVTVLLVFAVLEGALRLIGFRAETNVERMQFTFPIDDYNNNSPEPFLQRDKDLFWKPRPNVLGHNSQGCYGPEFAAEKPEGVFRIVCLGDSCTHFGPMSYPDILRAVLEKQAPGKFEVINAGVIGYTSFQGLTLLDAKVLGWSPDLVTVYFGWNDHWLARGLEDKHQKEAAPSGAVNALEGLRLFQLARMLKSGAKSERIDKMRVEPADYKDNLSRIHRRCGDQGAKVWFFTAPHALDIGIPPYLLSSGEISDPDKLIPLHQQYNSIVRNVAKTQQAKVIDLEAEMDQMDKNSLFIEDHIHLSQQGRMYLAQRLFQSLQQSGHLE